MGVTAKGRKVIKQIRYHRDQASPIIHTHPKNTTKWGVGLGIPY